MLPTVEAVAALIDHALLTPTMTDAELAAGCDLALRYRICSVCVKPYAVAQAAALLSGSGVKVGTVIGFPHGANATAVKCYETELACSQGAAEVDMVVNIGKALSGDWAYVEQDIAAVAAAAHSHGALCKVIFETDLLPDDAVKIRLCAASAAAGADFVKTSTGFGFVRDADGRYGYVGATVHDLRLMRANCPPQVGVKASGGIRDLDGLLRALEAGASRIGATATAAILDDLARRRAGAAPVAAGRSDSDY